MAPTIVVNQSTEHNNPTPTSSYLHNVGEDALRYITIGEVFNQTVEKFGARECIVSIAQNKRYTFSQMYQQINKFAAGLMSLGLKPGDRLGIWCPNLVEFYITKIACNLIGVIVATINPLSQAPEIEHCIQKIGIKAIVCPDEIGMQNYLEILSIIAPEMKVSEPGNLQSERIPSLKFIIIITDRILKGLYNFGEVLAKGDQNGIDKIKNSQGSISPDDVCDILFTSGSTGNPKAVMLSHFNLVNSAYFTGKRNELNRKPHKICTMIPFFHGFGTIVTMLTAIVHGATIVIPSTAYSPRKTIFALNIERCSVLHGTPTMYVDLVKIQNEENILDTPPEIAVWGGACISPNVISDIIQVLKIRKVKSAYGLTETTGAVVQSLPGQDKYNTFHSLGYLAEHMQAKVLDCNNKIVPRGKPGELCLRGYQNMLGYWGDEQMNREIKDKDGWLRTGDQCIMQEDGFCKVVGRFKDMINRGGENIFPREIENILNTHPDITEAHVIGLPDDRLGEEVCACVRIKNGSCLNLDRMRKFCCDKISKDKIPSQLRIVDFFPITSSGKIQKFKLVELFSK